MKEREAREKEKEYEWQEKEKDRALKKMELEVQREQLKTTASTLTSSVNGDSDEQVENVATVSKRIRGPKVTAFDKKRQHGFILKQT